MKPCLKKTALAVGVSAALIGVSTVSQAQITGDAGEANLVPFAVWSSGYVGGVAGVKTAVNTYVRVTVPSTVGNKTIPNVYTANNTTPNVAGGGAYPLPLGDQTPWETFLAPGTGTYGYYDAVHWYFMSYSSIELINGEFLVSPEDVGGPGSYFDTGYIFSLAEEATSYENQPGYLLFTTAEGAAGHEANFAFYADAWLETDNSSATGNVVTGPYSIDHADIPVLPMSDGDDTIIPTLAIDNQVIELSAGGPDASPWFSGLPTGWMGASAGGYKVFDLVLANRASSWTWGTASYYKDTLAVVWNDQNFSGWSGGQVSTDTFDTEEYGCSGSLSLPYELNVLWVPTRHTGTAGASNAWKKQAPLFVSGSYGGQTVDLCVDSVNGTNYYGEGFVRLNLPLVSTTNFATAAAFSIPVWSDGNYWLPTHTFNAHDRGAFSSQAGKWPGQ